MKKSYLLIIILALFSNIISAQQDSYKWKIGLHAGGMGYIGDLNTRIINPQTQWLADPLANLRPSFGLSLEYAPGANFGLRGMWSTGQFTANDRIVNFSNALQTDEPGFARGLNARTNIQDFSLIGTFYLQRSRPTKKRGFSPYLMIGAGLTNFEVYGDLFFDNDNRYYHWSDFTVRSHPEGTPAPEGGGIVLQDGDYETNLTELRTEDIDYETTVGNIPVGLGFKWRLADKLSLNFETIWHYTFTDYLDDVSGFYPISFDNPSALQSYASNPTGTQNELRGREEDRFNDIYSLNTISLNYSFGYNKKTPKPIDGIAYGDDTRTIKELTIITVNEKGDTLRIEQKVREDDAKEKTRLKELEDAKKGVEDDIALLEEQLRDAGELPETPTVEIGVEEVKTPEADIIAEPETTMTDTNITLPETPDAEGVVTEPGIEIITEDGRPARPDRPDISLGEEEVVIEIETPNIDEQIPDVEVEVEVPETRQSRRERRRNRNNVNQDIVIEQPEEPSVEIVVGDDVEIKLQEEIEVEQPEMPVIEIEMEEPENPVVEVEIETPDAEQPETPIVVIEMEEPETPVVEVEIETPDAEQPETPIVVIEMEEPETPIVEVEIETPDAEQPENPIVEIEMEEPETPVVEVEIETPDAERPETPIVEIEMEEPETPVVEVEIEAPEAEENPMVEVEMPEKEVGVETTDVAIETEMPKEEIAPKKPLTRRDRRRMRRNPPDINKEIDIDSEAAKVSEEVMAEVREEPVEEVVEEMEKPEMPAAEVNEEIVIETPTVEPPKPSSRPTREGALDPKISTLSTVTFNTVDDARKAYEGFYVPFEDEAYYVSKELYTELDAIVRTMNRFPALSVTLQGHTSEQEGMSFVHQDITRKRVHYLQNYLVTKGIALNRIQLNFFDDIANINEVNRQQVDVLMN